MKYKTDAFVFSPENNFIKPISTSKDDLQFFLSSCYAFLLRQLGNKKHFLKTLCIIIRLDQINSD